MSGLRAGSVRPRSWMLVIALASMSCSTATAFDSRGVCRLVNGEPAGWRGLAIQVYYHGDRASFDDWLRTSEIATRDVLSRCCIDARLANSPSPFGAGRSAILADKDESFPSETLIFEDGARVVVTREFWGRYEGRRPGQVVVIAVSRFVKRSGEPDHSRVGFSWDQRKLVWANSYYRAPGDIFPGGNVIHEVGHALGLSHPHRGNGAWIDPEAARDNFMTQGSWGQLPNRSVTLGQCRTLRTHATPS